MKSFNFEKYQGIGNDFIFISHSFLKAFKSIDEIKNFSIAACHRNYGIGGDGVIFYRIGKASKRFEILIINSDGSLGGTCGNALRCFGLKLFREKIWNGKKAVPIFRLNLASKNQHGLLPEEIFALDTKNAFSTLLKVEHFEKNEISAEISILFAYAKKIVDWKLGSRSSVFVELENPHLVFLSPEFKDFSKEQMIHFGTEMQKHINANIGMLTLPKENETTPNSFTLHVFERGAGLTMACGSGAVASALALNFTKNIPNAESAIILRMPGGSIEVTLPKNLKENIILCANAQFVFQGTYEY